MSKVPPTHDEMKEKKLDKRIAELNEQIEAAEKHWHENGTDPSQVTFADVNEFSVRCKLVFIFDLLEELTGKHRKEMDIRLKEIILSEIENMRPAMEESARQARAQAILRGIGPVDGMPS